MTNKLFIGGFSFSTTEQELIDELEKHGRILAIRLVMDTASGKSKGFAFVTYESEEAAEKAVDDLDNQEFGGRRIGVKPAIDRKDRAN